MILRPIRYSLSSPLHERLQPPQRLIPLLGHAREVGLGFLQRRRAKFEQALAPGPDAATRPAPSSTRRCLVIACRVRRVPCVSREIECGCRPTACRSATAASRRPARRRPRRGACSSRAARLRGRHGVRMFFICSAQPPSFMRNASSRAVAGDCIEAGLGDVEQRAAGLRLEPELDQRRRLPGVVDLGIDRVRDAR